MKLRIVSIAIALFTTVVATAQTADEKVGSLINQGKWFELREFYETNTDSVIPFLDSFARTMLGHFFNNPKQTLTYGADLLNNHSTEMGLGNVVSIGHIMSRAFYKSGECHRAADILESITLATKQYLDSATVAGMEAQVAIYKSLAPYKIYQTDGPDKPEIPFELKTIGKQGMQSYAMMLTGCKVNGIDCTPQFDTGAAVNVISDSLCNALGMRILDGNTNVFGTGNQTGKLAIADSLKLGDLIIRNVPFYVVTFNSGNVEADQYSKHMDIVVGIELMNALSAFSIDFKTKVIGTDTEIPTDITANLCFNDLSDINVKCTLNDIPALLTIDTGDASYGYINSSSIPELSNSIATDAPKLTRRMAGLGGVHITSYRNIPNITLSIADVSVKIPDMPYLQDTDPTSQASRSEGNLGIETFMLFNKVYFDMERMVIWPNL